MFGLDLKSAFIGALIGYFFLGGIIAFVQGLIGG